MDNNLYIDETALIDWLKAIRDARFKFELYDCAEHLVQMLWNKRRVAAFVHNSRHYDACIGVRFYGGYEVEFEPRHDTRQLWYATIGEPDGAGAIHWLRETAIADDDDN